MVFGQSPQRSSSALNHELTGVEGATQCGERVGHQPVTKWSTETCRRRAREVACSGASEEVASERARATREMGKEEGLTEWHTDGPWQFRSAGEGRMDDGGVR